MVVRLLIGTVLAVLFSVATFRALFLFKPLPPPEACANSASHQRIRLEQDAINRFVGALNIPTISYKTHHYEPEQLTRLIEHIKQSFPTIHRSGFVQREIVANHTLLYTIFGTHKGLRPYLLTSHLDVVPAVTEKWASKPFEAVIKEDKYLYARGTIDAKHLLMSIFEALETMFKRGFRPKRSILLVFGHDEEVGGVEGAQTISKLLPERVWQNNWDKIEYILDEGNIISKSKIPGLNNPVALIGVGEKGYLTVKVSTVGAVGHGSMPPTHTAISKLAKAIGKFNSHLLPSMFGQSVEREMLNIFALHASWPYKFFYANFWLFKPIFEYVFSSDTTLNSQMRSSTAVTLINGGTKENVLPDSAEAYINHRIHPKQTIADVLEFDRRTVNDPTISVEIAGHHAEPTPISPYCDTCPGYQLIKQSVLQVYPGTIVVPSIFLAASDSRWYTNLTESIYKFSAIAVLLDEMKCFHGHDERISLENYENLVNFYHHLITNSDAEDLGAVISAGLRQQRSEL